VANLAATFQDIIISPFPPLPPLQHSEKRVYALNIAIHTAAY